MAVGIRAVARNVEDHPDQLEDGYNEGAERDGTK